MNKLDAGVIDKIWSDCSAATVNMTPKDVFLFGVGVGAGMNTGDD